MKNIFLHKLTWQQKNKLLLAAIALLLWLVYAFAVSNTIELKMQCDSQQLQLDSAAGAPDKVIELKNELVRFASITGEQNDSLGDMHEHLLNFVTIYCNEHDLQLREFIQPIRYSQQEWIVETHPLTVEGNYIEIVQLIHALEQSATGRVVSADLHAKTDNKTKTKSLLATIYIQNILNAGS